MTQAERIIAKFGGIRQLAKALEHANPTTVQGWSDRGFIPARQQQEVLDVAQKIGVPLGPDDFFDLPDDQKGALDPQPQALSAASSASKKSALSESTAAKTANGEAA